MGADSPVGRRRFRIKLSDYQIAKAPSEWLQEIADSPEMTEHGLCPQECEVKRYMVENMYYHYLDGDFPADCPLGKRLEDLFMQIALIK